MRLVRPLVQSLSNIRIPSAATWAWEMVGSERCTVASSCNLGTNQTCGFSSDVLTLFLSLSLYWMLNYIPTFLYHFSFAINCLPSVLLPKLKFEDVFTSFPSIVSLLTPSDSLVLYLLFLYGYGTHQRQWVALVATNSVSFAQGKTRSPTLASRSH